MMFKVKSSKELERFNYSGFNGIEQKHKSSWAHHMLSFSDSSSKSSPFYGARIFH